MIPLIVATRNAHKVGEVRALLGDRFECLGLAGFPGAPNPEETGTTFAANARLKAAALAAWLAVRSDADSGSAGPRVEWVLADDSGLEVDALQGAPGVLSARFAAPDFGLPGNAPDGANNAKLLRLLAHVPAPARTARFRCALSLVEVGSGGRIAAFDGTCEGRIGFLQRGEHGFGYDPLFVPDGFDTTFAELGEETKNRLSHRARALEKLNVWWKTLPTAASFDPPGPIRQARADG